MFTYRLVDVDLEICGIGHLYVGLHLARARRLGSNSLLRTVHTFSDQLDNCIFSVDGNIALQCFKIKPE